MSPLCHELLSAMSADLVCEETERGARILTHCLYPSFEQVPVYVVRFGDGFIVHDGGECRSSAWLHGRDDKLITRCMSTNAARHGIAYQNNQIETSVPNREWLMSAILSVANAAAGAANEAVQKLSKSVADRLYERVREELFRHFAGDRVHEKVSRRGESGREYEFDFSVASGAKSIVVDVVTPFPASIAHRYRAFADSRVRSRGGAFVVHDAPLEAEDTALLSQVADVVPYHSLTQGLKREFALNAA